MSIKRYKAEQIVNLLPQVEMEIANGKAHGPRLHGHTPRPVLLAHSGTRRG